jgi:Holliday junction resolvase RusA-like endonuclease
MTSNNSAVPAVPEVISLLSSDEENESNNEIPAVQEVQYMTTLPVRVLLQRAGRLDAPPLGDMNDFWIDPSDPAEIEFDPSGSTAIMALFTVHGKPQSQMRARYRMDRRTPPYNPSARAQVKFVRAAKEALSLNSRELPLLPNQPMVMKIVFWVRRPNSHFIGNLRAPGRLRTDFQDPIFSLPRNRWDVDNLAKFVLDALNGVLYTDDSQVIFLQVVKMYDSTGSCHGRTEVCVCCLRPENLPRILDRSQSLFP